MKPSNRLKHGSDIRNMSEAEIAKSIRDAKKEMMDLRFQGAVGQLANPAQVQKLRKNVARLMTIANERKK